MARVIYLGSLGSMLVYGFWSQEVFTGQIARDFTLGTFETLLEHAHRDITIRTFAMAAAVSIACAVLAFPLAYYVARFATPRMRNALYLVGDPAALGQLPRPRLRVEADPHERGVPELGTGAARSGGGGAGDPADRRSSVAPP